MADYSSNRYGRSSSRWDGATLSIRLGELFGITIRVHIAFVIFMVLELLRDFPRGFEVNLAWLSVLWISILLHEFGHCFGARAVGGSADDVLLWPLGGLASVHTAQRPLDSLVATVCGPAVNFAICLAVLPLLAVYGEVSPSLFNPFGGLGVTADMLRGAPVLFFAHLVFTINYVLLLFNVLLPMFPMDGGRILQELLWFRMGYAPSMYVACMIGFYGGILFTAGSLYFQNILLAFVGVNSVIVCLQMLRQLQTGAHVVENEFGYDFSQGYTSLERSNPKSQKTQSRSLGQIFRDWQRRRQEAAAARLETEVDRILEKISTRGIGSLSRTEKRILNEASSTKRRRKYEF
ncbi:MAG: site-2 protease family protein [Planctomycetia bacterium]